MKKTTKSLLVAALILFCVGALLALSSMLFVKFKKIDPFGIEQTQVAIADKTVSLAEILAVSDQSNYRKKLSSHEFLKIDLLSYAGNIVVQSGKEFSLDFKKANLNNLHYEIIGDTLTVNEVKPVGFFGVFIGSDGVSYKGLRQIFGPGNSANVSRTITLTIPDDFVLDEVLLRSALGDTQLSGVSAKKISIVNSVGDVTVSDLPCSDSKVTIEGTFCDISIKECRYTSLAVATKLGSITAYLAADSATATVLDAWFGNVSITTHYPYQNYKWNASTMLGTVSTQNKAQGKSFTENGETANSRITSTLIVGSVNIFDLGETLPAPVNEEPKEDNSDTAVAPDVTETAETPSNEN